VPLERTGELDSPGIYGDTRGQLHQTIRCGLWKSEKARNPPDEITYWRRIQQLTSIKTRNQAGERLRSDSGGCLESAIGHLPFSRFWHAAWLSPPFNWAGGRGSGPSHPMKVLRFGWIKCSLPACATCRPRMEPHRSPDFGPVASSCPGLPELHLAALGSIPAEQPVVTSRSELRLRSCATIVDSNIYK
jgi:hypothetical protein